MRSCREAWTARRHLRSVLLGDESRHLSGFQLSLKSSLRVVTIASAPPFCLWVVASLPTNGQLW